MISHKRSRRALSISLLVLGGVLMFMAAEDFWLGMVLFVLGVVVEVAGLVLGHRE